MDEAREENRQRTSELKNLNELAQDVDHITSDGKITEDEILQLRKKLSAMEALLKEKSQKI
jgi:hypothetical protein